jgi:hypothetical protein
VGAGSSSERDLLDQEHERVGFILRATQEAIWEWSLETGRAWWSERSASQREHLFMSAVAPMSRAGLMPFRASLATQARTRARAPTWATGPM